MEILSGDPSKKGIPEKKGTNYYPFGLLMSGISDKAIKSNYAENKYRFNGGNELQNKEFSDGSGLEEYDATFRMYDPQIGRFWQIDPLADLSENSSPYAFVDGRPINYNDPSGLDTNWKVLPHATVTYTYQQPRANVNVDLADIEPFYPEIHEAFLWKIDNMIVTTPPWWAVFTGNGSAGKNLLGLDVFVHYYEGVPPDASFSRFNPKDILKLYKVIRNLQWSSRAVAEAAKLLLRGATEVTVENRSEAEELYLALYQEEGYLNTTGRTPREVRENDWSFPDGKKGTFHWDTEDTEHGGIPHLQIHDRDGNITRIFYKE